MNKDFYCPRKGCPNHTNPPKDGSWYRFYRTYETKVVGTQPRYICKRCGKTFSPRTFSIDYYTKKNISYRELLNQQISASGINDMARQMKCTTETVQNRIRRLSHQVMGAMAIHLDKIWLTEDVAADGLESFIESQFFPTQIDILVGQRSQFIYFFNTCFTKRKGRMTEGQKKWAEKLYPESRVKKGAVTRAFSQLLEHLDKIWDRDLLPFLVLDTDEHPVYPVALKKNDRLKEAMESDRLYHRKTNSRKVRNKKNKLFPCNYCDRMIRKDLAEHVRETVQFGKDQNFSMERFSLYQFWLNFLKPYRIKPRENVKYATHSEAAGISDTIRNRILQRVWHGNRVTFEEAESYLTPFTKDIWKNRVVTPTGKADRYLPKYAVA